MIGLIESVGLNNKLMQGSSDFSCSNKSQLNILRILGEVMRVEAGNKTCIGCLSF